MCFGTDSFSKKSSVFISLRMSLIAYGFSPETF